jgi:hypothetical protein
LGCRKIILKLVYSILIIFCKIYLFSWVDIFDQAGRTILIRVGNTAREMVMQGSLPQAAIKWSLMDLGVAATYHKLAGIR